MEPKIEYQLSSAMVEELAIEQIAIGSPNLKYRQWVVPVFFGIFFAVLFAYSNDYSQVSKEIITLIGFCLGFGCGLAAIIERNRRIKQQARVMLQKIGATRMISWDNEILAIKSSVSESKIKWQAIDKIKNGRVGIHLFVGGKIYFGLHKKGLPQNLSAEELIKMWHQPIPVI